MKWIKLKKYCELSGETSSSVHSKKSKGQWTDGVHYRIAPDGNMWINTEAVEKWVEQGLKATLSARRAA